MLDQLRHFDQVKILMRGHYFQISRYRKKESCSSSYHRLHPNRTTMVFNNIFCDVEAQTRPLDRKFTNISSPKKFSK